LELPTEYSVPPTRGCPGLVPIRRGPLVPEPKIWWQSGQAFPLPLFKQWQTFTPRRPPTHSKPTPPTFSPITRSTDTNRITDKVLWLVCCQLGHHRSNLVEGMVVAAFVQPSFLLYHGAFSSILIKRTSTERVMLQTAMRNANPAAQCVFRTPTPVLLVRRTTKLLCPT
jgi:hypothetical protein